MHKNDYIKCATEKPLQTARIVRIAGEEQLFLNMGKSDDPLSDSSYKLIPFMSKSDSQPIFSSDVVPAKWTRPIPIKMALACVVAYQNYNMAAAMQQGFLSLNVIFKPHQFRPLLKFLNDPRQRILIADQTGLGKTIEAGFIVFHEIMNGRASKILVVCPSHLKQKWYDDMFGRFGLDFRVLSGIQFGKYLLDGFPSSFKWIVSIDSIRSFKEALSKIDSEIIDILIIDEVHNAIGRIAQKGNTLRRDFCLSLSSSSRSVIGLTATPINLCEYDLYRILEIIRLDELDRETFEAQLEFNSKLNKLYSILGSKEWGEISIQNLRRILEEIETPEAQFPVTPEIHDNLISTLRKLDSNSSEYDRLTARNLVVEVNTFRQWMTRTTRAEANEDRYRVICKRIIPLDAGELTTYQGQSGKVTVSEASLYSEVDTLLKTHFSHVHRRQLSSSLYATRELIRLGMKGYKVWIEDGYEKAVEMDYYPDSESKQDERLRNLSNDGRFECEKVLGKYSLLQVDSKLDCLREMLDDFRDSGEITKCLVFTEWRPTMRYLRAEFTENCEYPCFFAWGEQIEDEREHNIRKFKQSDGFSVLFCSDALSEGIDLTEANCIVNYDLPYNPQRLEQRIGRVDRIGQKEDFVFAISLIIEGSIDESIHELLLERLDAFNRGIGPVSAVLAGQESILNSLGPVEQEYIVKEFNEKWNLQNHPSLTVIDVPLELIKTKIDESKKDTLEPLYWLTLYPVLSSLVGTENCHLNKMGDGFLISTNSISRRLISDYWGASRKDVMNIFASNKVLICSNSDKGKKIPITSSLYRKSAELLLSNIHNPLNGTLIGNVTDSDLISNGTEYLLMEGRVDGYWLLERKLAIFKLKDEGACFVDELTPSTLFQHILGLKGLFEVDSHISQNLISKYPKLREYFDKWRIDTIRKDRAFFSEKIPDLIRLLKRQAFALEQRCMDVEIPSRALSINEKVNVIKDRIRTFEKQLSSLSSCEDDGYGFSLRCLLLVRERESN